MIMRRPAFAAALLLCSLLSVNAFSQSTNATLGGTIQDASRAFIPGVTVTATNTGTGVVASVVSNEAGVYQFASLQPGTYDIKAELPGFQTAAAKSFQLGGAQQARLNFTMEVGAAVGTTVDVSVAADTLLATSSNSVGAILPEYKVRDLPLSTRDVFGLVAATPGTQGSGDQMIGNFAGGRLSAANTVRDGVNVSARSLRGRRMVDHLHQSRPGRRSEGCGGPGRCSDIPWLRAGQHGHTLWNQPDSR